MASKLSPRLAVAGLVAVLAAAVAGTASAAPGHHEPDVTVTVAATPGALSIGTGTCLGSRLAVELTNRSTEPVYADATVSAPASLHLQRTMVSSYLPAGYTRTASISVTAPTGTPAGTYTITVATDGSQVRVPVTVAATVPDPTGNLARTADTVLASTSHAGYPPCGAVDGDRDSAHWATTTGWNDGTSKVWPDWFQVTFVAPTAVGRADLYTLDSAKYPAARYGLRDWDIQALVGSQWQTVARVRGNTAGLVSTTFPAVPARAVRLWLTAGNGADDYSRIVELEIYQS
jgi:hypothetical protein